MRRTPALLMCLLSAAPAFAGDELLIQEALDTVKAFRLEAGQKYVLDAPLQLRAGQTLSGEGFSSVLEYRGEGDFAIFFGEEDGAANYGCNLKDLVVKNAGVRIQRFGQHCLIEGVWAIDAPAAGFHIEGTGDRFLLRDCIAYTCHEGFVIRTRGANNGLILDHCNAQGCWSYGLRCETVDNFHAYLGELLVRDFTCQGNARDGETTAEILLRGSITECRFQHLYVEAVSATVGIRCEAQRYAKEKRSRGPRNLCLADGSRIEGKSARAAVELIDCTGFEVRDSRLRLPIVLGKEVGEPVQSGPFTAATGTWEEVGDVVTVARPAP